MHISQKAIEVINLRKKFKDSIIFEGLTFSIDLSKRILIYGKNGSGKTTLLKILSGYIYADGGEIKILGKKIPEEEDDLKGKVFYVSPEERSFYFPLSVERNLKFFLNLFENFKKERLDFYIKHFKIDKLIKKPFSVLSSGEKQRVALVRAFSSNPEIFLLDEPQKSLDLEGLELLKEAILNLKDKIFLIATPKMDGFENFFDEKIELC